ncbi:hypothetical protein [Pseudomonas sp.]|uniref:hypothetical protein n=1 Tax=Pseudomonas sp. TaxID=306 RepID=UPI00258F0A92|nr:hypothetical protein [Pseudomonas sp.]
MGLLGDSWDDPRTMGALQLAAGLLSGGNFGTALGKGLAGYGETIQNAERMKYLKQQMEGQTEENRLRKAQVEKALKDQEKQDRIEALALQFYRPGSSAASNALGAAAAAGGGAGPTKLAGELLPAAQATPGGFDMQGYMAALMQVDPLKAVDLMQNVKKANEVQLNAGQRIIDRSTGKVLFEAPETPNLTFVPGDGYRPDVMVDSKRGIVPIQGAAGALPGAAPIQPGGASPVQPAAQPTVDPRAPWVGMPPKQADEFRKSVYEQEAKKLEDLRKSVAGGQRTLAQLEQFGELNRETGTGGLLDKWLPEWATLSSDKQNMLSIQNALTPGQRAPGSGAASDADMRLYKSGLPGIDKGGDVNKDIRLRYAELLRNDQQELAFKERYLAQNGHLNGADEAFAALKAREEQGAPSGQQGVTLTPNGKMLSGQKRAALDAIIKSGNPTYLAQARAKGWIQ